MKTTQDTVYNYTQGQHTCIQCNTNITTIAIHNNYIELQQHKTTHYYTQLHNNRCNKKLYNNVDDYYTPLGQKISKVVPEWRGRS